jgi:hypothetical protein
MDVTSPRLENWSFTGGDYVAPELRRLHLQGEVYGDERFEEGKHIVTSSVIEFLPDENPLTATTRHTLYKLGEISPKFAEWMKTEGLVLEEYRKPKAQGRGTQASPRGGGNGHTC